jgi:F-type H+-transporting ATPase subunit b
MLDFSVTFVITLVNFGVLFLILRAILFKPVSKFMAERARKVQNDKDEAERAKNEAEAIRLQLEGRLKNAEEEAAEIIKAAREEARESAGAIVTEGRAEAERQLAQARLQARSEYQAALRLFQAEAAALVVTAAGRLIERDLSLADHREQAAALIRDLEAFSPGKSRV